MFDRRFSLKADEVISRTLGIIQGPQTDVRAWLELIDGALAGCSTNGVISVYMRDGTAATEAICCTPVLGKDDIEFVRITIGTTQGRPVQAQEQAAAVCALPRVERRSGRHACKPTNRKRLRFHTAAQSCSRGSGTLAAKALQQQRAGRAHPDGKGGEQGALLAR
jgi:hypothetical protein